MSKGESMCFSLKMSLVSATYLLSIAYLCHRRMSHRRILILFPLLFGLQQLAEAAVWATFDYGLSATIRHVCSYLYLLFAYLVWPVFVPYCFYQIEPPGDRKRQLQYLCFVGLAVCLYLLVQLLRYPLTIDTVCGSIRYYLGSFGWTCYLPIVMAYLLAVVVPCLVSSIPRSSIFGLGVFGAWVVSAVVYEYAFTSVWCFFAALISSGIYWLL